MSLIKRIKGIFRKKEEVDEVIDNIDMVVEKIEKRDKSEDIDPWRDFKSICKEVGADYTEVISKAAWYYLEETGGVSDEFTQAKELVNVLKDFESTVKDISEPKSVKKLRMYNEALKEVAEFKEKIREVKSGKITARDLLPILTKLMKNE